MDNIRSIQVFIFLLDWSVTVNWPWRILWPLSTGQYTWFYKDIQLLLSETDKIHCSGSRIFANFHL